ncbi:MAG: zeta toxin family protein [Acidobacteriaceae bacterium]|nr:zeta toxin family protein [Acidobacteriaceae bacterium]
MFIIAGPPGGGKSSIFSLSAFASRTFNADDRAAELNGGSYQDIPLEIRRVVNREFEQFVEASIDAEQSFALETTLRSDITFEQAKMAQSKGFRVVMRYIALDNVEKHLERVRARAALGGHSASEGALRRIHASSLANLPKALDPRQSGIEFVRIYDNSADEQGPELVLTARRGRIIHVASPCPIWLQQAMGWSNL